MCGQYAACYLQAYVQVCLLKRNLPEKTAGTRGSIHDNSTKLFHNQDVQFQQKFQIMNNQFRG